ncbi:MAG: type II toxin-antitoxin system Phd/YefM family antitoxin [Pseudomonadota bacterium]|nr:type II toxin-antitoxin system Phd/YefM family antitoxin [Pseudomonadota bacterium]
MLSVLTADEAKRRFGALLKQADDSPVILTRHGRPRCVVLSAQLFQALLFVARANEARKIGVAAKTAMVRFARQDIEGGAAIISEAHGQMRRLDRLSVR